jgi:membrane protein implicated in regulation of membrane protease activity
MDVFMSLPWFWIWLVAAALLYIGEMLTTTFYLLPFAIGATVALIVCALAGPLWLQWLLFAVVSVIALALLRPVAHRVTRDAPEKSGVDRLIGRPGEVIEGRAPNGEFRVRVERDVWNALCADGSVPTPGTHIKVDHVDGTHLIVTAEG